MKKIEILPSIGYYVKSEEEFSGANYENQELNNLVNNFYNVLTNKIGRINLNLLCFNINSLIIKEKIYPKLSLFRSAFCGEYNPYSNTIKIDSIKDISTFNHEMLHMASSFFDDNNNVAYMGFMQETKKYSIGYSLTEGYTELLNLRLFYDKDEEAEYEYDMIIAFLVERIIGTEKMKKLFFNADLLGLVKELKRYYAGREVLTFISYLDNFHDYMYYSKFIKKEDIIFKINFINSFLINTYIEKLKIDVEKGKIDKETASSYYLEFYCILCDIIKYLPKKLKYCYNNLYNLTKKKTLNSR